MRIIQTCKDCKERFLGCHDVCQRYNEAKAEQSKRMQQFFDGNKGEREMTAYLSNRKGRTFK